MPLVPLEAEGADQWLAALPGDSVSLLYKHSPRCGTSLDASMEVRDFVASHPDLVAWHLDVIRQRALSRELARILGIRHESPQVILLRGRTPVWHTSHQRISSRVLADQLLAARQG